MDSPALETLARLAFWFTAFTFGESFPLWGVLSAAALSPVVLWLLWRSLRSDPQRRPAWLPLVALSAFVGFLGASLWVALPFTPARLLFLLPFYLLWLVRAREMAPQAGTVIFSGILIVWLGALSSYYQRDGFLNKGYLIPFSEMAGYIKSHSAAHEALVVIDGYNADPQPLLAALRETHRCLVVRGPHAERRVREQVRQDAGTVWYLRSTHDISPGAINRRLETELAEGYGARVHKYLPYSPTDRFLMRLLGWRALPTHHYQMMEFRSRSVPPDPSEPLDKPTGQARDMEDTAALSTMRYRGFPGYSQGSIYARSLQASPF